LNNLKQLALGANVFQESHKRFPSSALGSRPVNTSLSTGQNGSVIYQLLPYIEEKAIYDQFPLGPVPAGTKTNIGAMFNQAGWIHPLKTIRCPSSPDEVPNTVTSAIDATAQAYNTPVRLGSCYYGVMGAIDTTATDPTNPNIKAYTAVADGSGAAGYIAQNGMLFPESNIKVKNVLDGLSHTFLLGESSHEFDQFAIARVWAVGSLSSATPTTYQRMHTIAQYGARNITFPINSLGYVKRNDASFGSFHMASGTHFAFGDGSCRFISENIEFKAYQAAASRQAGEAIGEL
jgi:hypothetical protein